MLQPLIHFGPTRGNSRRRNLPSVVAPDSSANDVAAMRQQVWNEAAATSKPSLASTNPDQPTYAALAKALGYQPGETTPSMGALMAKFQSLPSSVKVGIYKAGGAQFIAPEDASDQISKQEDALEKVHDTHTNAVVDAITAGKIEPIKDSTGKMTWVVNQEQDIDPNNPILGKKKVQVPANPVIQGYINRAQSKGYIPDPSTGMFPDNGSAPLSKYDIQRRMSSEDFQKVLDARANGTIEPDAISIPSPSNALSANLASTLAATKNANFSGNTAMGASNMQIGAPYSYGSNLDFKEPVGEMQGPPMPSPRVGYIPSGRLSQDVGINNEALQNATASILSKGVNAISRGVNWVGQQADNASNFLLGGDEQSARLPMLSTDFDPVAPDPAEIAWRMAHNSQ